MGNLYCMEEFTAFSLVSSDAKFGSEPKAIKQSFVDINFENLIELRCAKCNEQLTEEEYGEGKLQETKSNRKLPSGRVIDPYSPPEDIARYQLEHKRCKHRR